MYIVFIGHQVLRTLSEYMLKLTVRYNYNNLKHCLGEPFASKQEVYDNGLHENDFIRLSLRT